jgi:hypothetical protein
MIVVGGEGAGRGEVAQTMFIHMSKYKNNKCFHLKKKSQLINCMLE